MPHGREWWILVGYGLLFHIAHTLAASWGGVGFFSLWYPPAGLRFALLWLFGARLTLPVTVIELLVQILAGILDFHDPDWLTRAISIIRPALAYGFAIGIVRRLTREPSSTLSTPPMPFGLAAALAPVTAVLAALPWSIARPDLTGVSTMRDIVASLTTFAVGDLLGVLILAPPIIALAEAREIPHERDWGFPTAGQVLEYAVVLGSSGAVTWVTVALQLSDSLTPVMLAASWIGLRFNRTAVWVTIVIVAFAVFPMTSGMTNGENKLSIHMSVATVAIAGYLAASFSTAMRRAQEQIARRDRMLLHSERLATLRSMSIAIIHEVSQPLSTLLLETRHLKSATLRIGDQDLIETADLVERKTAALATMTRRLREFGSRGGPEKTSVPVRKCIDDALAILAADFPRLRDLVCVEHAPEQLNARAMPLELTQCFLNLLRNSLQAVGPTGQVHIILCGEPESVLISIDNSIERAPTPDGMGVGLVISQTIIETLGGRLVQSKLSPGVMRTVLTLPRDRS